jgi:hypothetical protein
VTITARKRHVVVHRACPVSSVSKCNAAPGKKREKMASSTPISRPLGLVRLVLALIWIVSASAASAPKKAPIMLDRTGGFSIGGRIKPSPNNPDQTLSCDWGYMEYFIPVEARRTAIVMWHSSSTQVWQNRWDGGEGFKDKFLRRGYPVYIWDPPRVGRANWACEPYSYSLSYRDQGNFAAWNLGRGYPNYYNDTQFPKNNENAWYHATRTRYMEFDTENNIEVQTDAAAVAIDSGLLGDSIVFLTNSASGLRAMYSAIKAKTNNTKGIVNYETIGLIYPDDSGIRGGGGFDYVIPSDQFDRLANVKGIQFVWGDHRDDSFSYYPRSKMVMDMINERGGNAELVHLGQDKGLKGSTHSPFMDMDNDKVAEVLDEFLAKHELDGYAADEEKAAPKVEVEVEVEVPGKGAEDTGAEGEKEDEDEDRDEEEQVPDVVFDGI